MITIEDAAELRLSQPHVVSLEARPPNVEGLGEVTVRSLVRNALRMRPDRIIVGEVRGGEALDMLQAMNTGHEGSMSTAHANSPRDLLSRLETMALMSDVDLPVSHVREQVANALDVIVHMARLTDGRRAVVRISATQGLRAGSVGLEDVFVWRRDSPTGFQACIQGASPVDMLARRRQSLGRATTHPSPGQIEPAPIRSGPNHLPRESDLKVLKRSTPAWPGNLRRLGTILE